MDNKRAVLWAGTVGAGVAGLSLSPVFFAAAGALAVAARFAREEELQAEQYHKDFVKPLHAYRKKAVRAVGEEQIAAQASLETLKIQAEFHKRAAQTIGLNPAVHPRLASDLRQKFGLIPPRAQHATASPAPAQQQDEEFSAPPLSLQFQEREDYITESNLMFPVVDLGAEIAESLLNTDSASSFMIACPRRTGKTSLLESVIAHFHRLTNGTGQVNIFNGKETRDKAGKLKDDFCGLAYNRSRYLCVESPEEAQEMADRLECLRELMRKPRDYYVLNILDEYNNMLLQADAWDLTASASEKVTKKIKSLTVHRATAGSSRKMCDIITSHSPYVDDIGINKAMQDNFLMIILARGQFTSAIEKALTGGGGQKPIVRDGKECEKLLQDFQSWAATKDEDHVCALTNLGGWRLVFLPPKGIVFKVPGAAEKVPQPQPKRESPKTGAEAIQEIVTQILQVVGQNPTDEDLINAYDRVCTPNRAPSDPESRQRLIEYLRENLNGKT